MPVGQRGKEDGDGDETGGYADGCSGGVRMGGLATAGHNVGGSGTFKPTKIVQGVIKAIDFQRETVTVEIVEGQPMTLKVHVDALDQLDRTGKVGKRVELRLNEEDIVHVVAVGLGP